MISNTELGQKIAFICPKTKKIVSGKVAGENIGQSGHPIISIMLKDGKKVSYEAELVFTCKESAEKVFDEKKAKIEKLEAMRKAHSEEEQALRLEIIGQPIHKELAEKIING